MLCQAAMARSTDTIAALKEELSCAEDLKLTAIREAHQLSVLPKSRRHALPSASKPCHSKETDACTVWQQMRCAI